MKLRKAKFEIGCRNAGGTVTEETHRHKDEHGMVMEHTTTQVCDLGDRGELQLIEERAPADSTLTGEVDGERLTAFGVDHKFRDVEMTDDNRLIVDGKLV